MLVRLLAVVLLFIPFIGAISCTHTSSIDDAVVQVWESDTMLSTGVIVDDGTHVLTIFEYRFSMPSSLDVVVQKHGRYRASVQAVDFRTGATLLKIQGGPFPVAAVSSVAPEPNQQVLILEWSRVKGVEQKDGGIREILGDPVFHQIPATTVTGLKGSPPEFVVAPYAPQKRTLGVGVNLGDVVTDEKGNVLGLIGNTSWGLITAHPLEYPRTAVGIESLSELMSPDAAQQIRARGPSAYSFVTPNSATAPSVGPINYEEVAVAIQELLNSIGKPLVVAELMAGYSSFPLPAGGTVLVAAYVFPIDLRTKDGTLLAQAKWVAIQWGNSGKPNSLLYGSVPYEPQGAFELAGDIAILERAER